jgi:hypothetical protein
MSMKITSLFIAALVVLNSAVAFASEDEPRTGFAVISVKGREVFKVIYQSESAGRVKLNIYNSKGSVIYTETFYGTDGFIMPLNFKGLSAGEYTIEVVSPEGRKLEKVQYNPANNTKQIRVSKIAGEEGKYLLAIANSGKEMISVNIYDQRNHLVFHESKTIDGEFAQIYKLENTSSSYTFEVTDQDGNAKRVTF